MFHFQSYYKIMRKLCLLAMFNISKVLQFSRVFIFYFPTGGDFQMEDEDSQDTVKNRL